MRTMILLAVAVVAFGAEIGRAEDLPPKVNTKEVMRFKLMYAQRVLEAIATENFELLADNAQKLKKLSGQADWMVRDTPEYQRFTKEFAAQADALSRAASKRSVDAATVAYFQMTVSCTSCHRYLREDRDVGFNFDSSQTKNAVAQNIIPSEEKK